MYVCMYVQMNKNIEYVRIYTSLNAKAKEYILNVLVLLLFQDKTTALQLFWSLEVFKKNKDNNVSI